MKTKILVSSDSGIDYMSHSYSISSIPSMIKFFEIETYFDYIDITSEKFFNRLKYDTKVKPEIMPMQLDYLRNDINVALESYDNVLIVVSDLLDYSLTFNFLKDEYGKKIDFYVTPATGFVLSTMVIEADKALKEEKTIKEAIKVMENIYNNSAMLLLNPQIDISISENVNEEKRVEEKRKGKINIVTSAGSKEIIDKDRDFVVALIKNYLDLIGNENVLPYIMYSSSYSYYLKLLESKLLIIHKRYKTIKKIPISPNLGMKYGKNVIAIGFIRNLG